MRGYFAKDAGIFGTHSVVIALKVHFGRYSAPMRAILIFICGFLLLASLSGLSHPEHLSHGPHADEHRTVSLMPDSLCGDGSGHGACQLVAADQPSALDFMVATESTGFEITPVAAASRTFAPHTPPPRPFF
jgi:hypothetical protein